MSALVGALRAMLTLDSANFVDGAKKANRSRSQLEGGLKKMSKTMIGVGAAMGAAAAGLGLAIKGSLNLADDMGEAAQKFGVPIEELSRLKYAADLSDVSLDTLGASLGKLSKSMVSAAGGNKAQIALFGDLGVEVTDANGKLRATESVLRDVAAKFAIMPDGPEKTAAAIRLFGKAGADMIPLLNLGKKGLAEMAKEANALGIVITKETAEAADKFNENLKRLKAAMGGLVMQITAALAPTLAQLSDWAVKVSNAFNELSPATKELIVQVGAIIGVISLAALAFGALSLAISPLSIVIAAVAAGAVLIYQNWDGIAAWFAEQWDMITTATDAAWTAIKTAIGGSIDYVTGKWDAFIAKLQAAVDVAKRVGQAIADALPASSPADYSAPDNDLGVFTPGALLPSGGSNSSTNAGRSTADGLVEGFKSRLAERLAEVAESAGTIATAVRARLGIQSPSTVMREIGQHTTEGLALGIKDNAPMVQNAMAEIGDAIEGDGNSLQSRLEGFKSSMEGAFVGLVTGAMTFKQAIGSLAKSLADMLAKQAFQQLFGQLFSGGGAGGAGAGGAGGGGFLSSLFGGAFADGAAFRGGRVQAFASGGVVNGATAFAMQGGMGVMGEAGPEAIMPLTRGANGKLGVQSSGGGQQRILLEVAEGDLFASRVSTIADSRSVQIVKRYDRDVAPQTRQRAARERG